MLQGGAILRRHAIRLVVVLVGLLVATGWWALRAPRVQEHVRAGAIASTLEAAIADVDAGRQATPLVGEPTPSGDATVTFLARGDGGAAPRIVSDVTGWGEAIDGTFDVTVGTMARVGRTDWYSLQAKVAARARIEYLIAYGPDDYRLDPHNPRRTADRQLGGIPASEFAMPGYAPPPEFVDPPVTPAGLLTEATIESGALGVSCPAIVYTPPGYRDDGEYPVAVFLDQRASQVARVLDWLIAHRAIAPVVAVFVGPTPHGSDRPTGAAMRAFLTGEVLTWMASRYSVSRQASRRAIIGISYGAKDALDAAISPGQPPNSATGSGRDAGGFDRLGLLVPGRRIDQAYIDAVAGRRDRRLRVAILAGRYDRANVATARAVRQALAEAGHAVEYAEVPEGHSAVTWIHNLRVVLIALFGDAR